MKKLIAVGAGTVVCCAQFLFADVPSVEMPDAAVVDFLNGKLNLVTTANADSKLYTSSKSLKGIAYEVQIKAADSEEDAWESVTGAICEPNNLRNGGQSQPIWVESARSVRMGTFDVRARMSVTNGAVSAWKVLGTATAYNYLLGTVIASPKASGYKTFLSDGSLWTYFEDASSDPSWGGVDFGCVQCVTKIRYCPRGNSTTCITRATGAEIQVADDANFTQNVRTLYTVPKFSEYKVYDVALPEPVYGRCFRIKTKKSGCCNFNQLELIGVHMPVLSVKNAGNTDFRPELNWTVDPRDGFVKHILYRGHMPEGPFAELGEFDNLSEDVSFIDDTAVVGLPNYYFVRGMTGDDDPIALDSGVCAYIRGRQLERAEEDQTTLRTGVTMLPANKYDSALYAGRNAKLAFDGLKNWDSSPDIFYGTYNPVIGVQFADPVCIFGVSVYSMGNGNGGRTGACFASRTRDDFDNANNVQLTEEVPITSSYQWKYVTSVDSETLYSCVFMYGVAGSAYSKWCGNMQEVKFIGCTLDDLITSGRVLRPGGVSAAAEGGKVIVSWQTAYNATTCSLERRLAGETEWTSVGEAVPGTDGQIVDPLARANRTYEYRVRAVGMNGMMYAYSDVVTVAMPPAGLILMVL